MTAGAIQSRSGKAPTIGTLIAAVVAVGSIGAFVLTPFVDATADPTAVGLFGAATTSVVLVGFLLVWRVPGNRIGPLLVASGGMLATAYALSTYALTGAKASPPPPGVAIAGIVSDLLFILPIVIALIVIPLVFPTGHLLSRRWRPILWLLVAALTAQTISVLVGTATVDETGIANPFHVASLEPLATWLDTFSSASSVIGFGGAAAAVWVRFRRGDRVEREQLKWLVVAPAIAAIAFPVAFLVPQPFADLAFAIGLLTLIGLPLAIGVAVLRYRLFEIDRIISRTLSYAIVTGLLGAVFVVVILVLQTVLAGAAGQGGIPVAISTLAVFALFQPVLRRVRRAVDRRFDRAHYDGEQTASTFAARLRRETDIDRVTSDLRTTVEGAMSPTTLAIWLRDGTTSR